MAAGTDVHFRLSEEWKKRLEEAAESHGMNQSSIMRRGTIREIRKLEGDRE